MQINTDDRRERALAQLDRVLGFFSRAESKMSFLFALDSALLATVGLNLQAADFRIWYVVVPAGTAASLLAASLYQLYRSWSPNLTGGTGSLVYFREIARLDQAAFAEKFRSRASEEDLEDILGQIWRNSVILTEKFARVHRAFRLTALALVPWCAFLIGSVVLHGRLPVLS